ncbi:unnamed protein product [Dibothriocephalus latus]|uniref:Uncharacterized protein n=1 Tax=Dibothriocephalus latus TaxID=60516 RepID=A0A3P7P420_DIBLA|nr:unnamed protein product [Dibothriocephalus latus]
MNAEDDSDYSSISTLDSSSTSDSSIDAQTFLQRIRDKTRLKAKKVIKTSKSPCYSSSTSVSSDCTEEDFQMALQNLLKSSAKSVDPGVEGTSVQSEGKKGMLDNLEQVRDEMAGREPHGTQKVATGEQLNKLQKHEGDCSLETSTSNPLLGFSTGSNGEVSFGAFIRLPQDGPQYLKSFCQRAERHLKGLQCQYNCKIHIAEEPVKYRATNVYHLTISGAAYRNVLRCKNGLPSFLSKLLITSHGNNEDFMRCRPNRR